MEVSVRVGQAAEDRQAFLENESLGEDVYRHFLATELQVLSRITCVEPPVHDYAAFTPNNKSS